MRKTITIILTVVLAITMFCACSGESDQLIGTWKGELDMTDAVNQYIASEDMGEAAGYFELSSFKISALLTFSEDGTYSLTLDEASIQTAFDGMMEDLRAGMVKMFEDQIADLGVEMTVEEMLAATGLTMDGLMEELKKGFEEEGVVEEMAEQTNTEGRFMAEGGKLFMSDSKNTAVDLSIYDTYTVEGSTLTLIEHVGGDAEGLEGIVTAIYPMVFEKAS